MNSCLEFVIVTRILGWTTVLLSANALGQAAPPGATQPQPSSPTPDAKADATAVEEFLPKPIMMDAANGWWQKVGSGHCEILHTSDAGKHWQNVTPQGVRQAVDQQSPDHQTDPFLMGRVNLDPLDGTRLWVAAPLADENKMLVLYTGDGGQHWRQNTAPVADDNVSVRFLDELQGFLLATSDPAAGLMDKNLLATDDGGRHWRRLAVPKAGGYYVNGFDFCSPDDGWIAGNYHGGDSVPLYVTHDGAKTWALQELPLPPVLSGHQFYGVPSVPKLEGPRRQHGTLTVVFKQHVDKPNFEATVEYHSEDAGETWRLPAGEVRTVPVE